MFNKDDIIRMAREAGLPFHLLDADYCDAVGLDRGTFCRISDVGIIEFERFAALVAAAERNRTWTQEHWTEYERSIAAAEREAVIGLLRGIDMTETEDTDGWWETSAGAAFGAERIAAIRARGEAT